MPAGDSVLYTPPRLDETKSLEEGMEAPAVAAAAAAVASNDGRDVAKDTGDPHHAQCACRWHWTGTFDRRPTKEKSLKNSYSEVADVRFSKPATFGTDDRKEEPKVVQELAHITDRETENEFMLLLVPQPERMASRSEESLDSAALADDGWERVGSVDDEDDFVIIERGSADK